MTRQPAHPRSDRCRGFTLIEMVSATLILAVVLLGTQSAMMLASRVTPDGAGAAAMAARAAAAIDQLAADLSYATAAAVLTATCIEFTVPDRNGDGSPETLRYSWSGIAGDPLLRSVNGAAASAIAAGVTEFELAYNRRSAAAGTTYAESGEVLLCSNTNAGLLTTGDADIDSKHWFGECFTPSVPSGTVSWRITRVGIKARAHGSAAGSARIQVRTASGSTPGVVLDEALLQESALGSSYGWQEFTFGNVPATPAGTGLCVAAQWGSDADACDVQYQALASLNPSTCFVSTANGGATWSSLPGQDLIYYVYGTYSTANPAIYTCWLTGVRCTLRCGTDPAGRLRTTVRLFNEPQVSGG